ncbi:MAG: peptidase [Verrucomicrobia bacterium]|jgi:carboxypeptidase Q|nr:peptidase [Verrucomicrobiota bacterium]
MSYARQALLALITLALSFTARAADHPDQAAAKTLLTAATSSTNAYARLAYMCDTFGPRFSGSTNLESSIDWILTEMKRDGFTNVRGEPVVIPRWIRGQESLELVGPRRQSLPMLGLGGSIATKKEGITGPVFVVRSFEELAQRRVEAIGKIVVFNVPYDDYHKTVAVRTRGAIEAGRAGAVASLVRSITPISLQTPHTGNMAYDDAVPKIPHAAITIEDAEMLQRLQDRGEKPVVRLKMEATTLPDGLSRNVVAEIRGSEKPHEIVLVSGHIDSWDIGQGAQDDGGGCIAAWESARLIMASGLKPRRTIRVVFWTNEENGVRGAKSYANTHSNSLAKHVAAIESDSGIYQPLGFGLTGSEKAMTILKSFTPLLEPVGATQMEFGCRGTDVLQLLVGGVPAMHLEVDRKPYFNYHHTAADTVDKVSPIDLNSCTAALAIMVWSLANSAEPLPR